MPLLEVVQTRQISASIRLSDTTATLVDQYAAFIRACADDVVEQALTYVFSKDRRGIRSPAEEAGKRNATASANASSGGGIESMIPHRH